MASDLFKPLNKIRNKLELLVEPSPFSAEGKQIELKEALSMLEKVIDEVNPRHRDNKTQA